MTIWKPNYTILLDFQRQNMIMYTLPFLLSMLRSMDEDARYLISLFSHNDIVEQMRIIMKNVQKLALCKNDIIINAIIGID